MGLGLQLFVVMYVLLSSDHAVISFQLIAGPGPFSEEEFSCFLLAIRPNLNDLRSTFLKRSLVSFTVGLG